MVYKLFCSLVAIAPPVLSTAAGLRFLVVVPIGALGGCALVPVPTLWGDIASLEVSSDRCDIEETPPSGASFAPKRDGLNEPVID